MHLVCTLLKTITKTPQIREEHRFFVKVSLFFQERRPKFRKTPFVFFSRTESRIALVFGLVCGKTPSNFPKLVNLSGYNDDRPEESDKLIEIVTAYLERVLSRDF